MPTSMRLLLPAALSFTLLAAACSGGGSGSPTPTPTPVPTPGITANWVVNKPGGCGAVTGAASVSILATLQGTALSYAGTAPCTGTTSAGTIAISIPSNGTYVVGGSVVDGSMQTLGDSAPQNVTVSGPTTISVSITPF